MVFVVELVFALNQVHEKMWLPKSYRKIILKILHKKQCPQNYKMTCPFGQDEKWVHLIGLHARTSMGWPSCQHGWNDLNVNLGFHF